MGAELADMQLINKYNKVIQFLLCVIDIPSKYIWVVPLKGKESIKITNVFQKVLDEPNHRPNSGWRHWILQQINKTIVTR